VHQFFPVEAHVFRLGKHTLDHQQVTAEVGEKIHRMKIVK
jgi:hypothetical protein